nr:immunoglobulin heavy chain junction region [Mus musculus]NSM06823.1 immunoglobulin heavy chain junction region [Mus musculus]NSM07439.1 immunoglobulin heavy chain junction region [Mus musculus]
CARDYGSIPYWYFDVW